MRTGVVDRRHLLEAQLAELLDEVRNYPTPIARCDVQLTELLERRTLILAELARFREETSPEREHSERSSR